MGKIMRIVCLALVMQCAFGADAAGLQDICKVCHCVPKEKQVLCNNVNLLRLFTDSDWTALNATSAAELENVRFDNNGISVVTPFPNLRIVHLSFRHNTIRKIENLAFANLTYLESLDLSHNNLKYEAMSPKIFEGRYDPEGYTSLKNLKVLNLSHNEIHTLDPDIFEHFPHLEKLDIGFNPFKVIDQNSAVAISSVPTIVELIMSDLEVNTLPDTMFHAPRGLKKLDLSGNLFTKIPDAIAHAIELVTLNLDDNIFDRIGTNESGGAFPTLPKLTELSISFMPTLTHIEAGAFSNLVALRQLHAQSNQKLQSIHNQAFSRPGSVNHYHTEWPPVTSLILYNNNLSVIPQNLLDRWDEMEEIDLRFNNWQCDCENQWMIDTLMPIIKLRSPTLMEDMRCRSPDEMAGKTFGELFKNAVHMRCLDYYGRHPERDGPILVGILIGLLIGVPISMIIIFLYKRGCFGIFGYKPNPNDYTRAFYKRAGLHENLEI